MNGSSQTPRPRWRLLALAATVALAAAIALYARVWGLALLDLDTTEYGEGPLLAFALRWAAGSPAPSWLSEIPLSLTVYGPGFPWIWQAVVAMSPGADPLAAGRWLSTGMGVLLVLAAAWVAWRTSRSIPATLLGVLALVSSPIVPQFFAHARVDTMAALFVIAAYVAFDSSGRRIIAVAALLAVGSLVKQTAVLHVVPLAIVAAATSGWRPSLKLAAATAAFTLAVWIPVFLAFDGFFWQAAVKGNLNPLSVWHGADVIYRVIYTPQFVIAMLSAWVVALELRVDAVRNRWLVGFVFALISGAALSFKIGSSINYFQDALLFGAVVIAQAAAVHLRAAPAAAHAAAFAVACVAATPQFLGLYATGVLPPPSAARERLVREVLAPETPVLADGHLVAHALRAGGRVLVNDPFVLRLMAEARPELAARVIDALDPRLVVILDTPLETRLRQDAIRRGWPPQVLSRLKASFCLHKSGPDLYIYRDRTMGACLEGAER
jgi:hypothetical protein